MSKPRASISAALRSRRALLLAEGRRRFYVHPLDVGPFSKLGRVPQSSLSDCIASAHSWLQRVKDEGAWWFRVVERAEIAGESVAVSVQDILVYSDLLPLRPSRCGSEGGCDSGGRPLGRAEPGASGAAPGTGTFKATDGKGVPCRRNLVPCHV